MYIQRLVLHGYKRLMLNNINHFEYTPTSAFQIILGTNGSGKSSILAEMGPLPASPEHYTKDGSAYKEIHILHKGASYVLRSELRGGSGKHTFVRDGEDLNPGRTVTIQKELVRREFGVWVDLQDLLLGRERFTTMAPARRREWITTLAPSDYTYAFNTFDTLKSRARDTQGALKHDRQRLVQETQNLQALGDLSGVEEQCRQWREELNVLLISKPAQLKTKQALEHDLRALVTMTERVGTDLLRNIPTHARQDYHALSDVQDHITRVTQEIESVKGLLDHYATEYRELEELTVALEGETLDVGAAEAKFMDYEQQAQAKRQQLRHFPQLIDAEAMLVDLQSAFPALVELFQALPNNSERIYTKDTIGTTREGLAETRRLISLDENRINLLDTKLEHMNQAKDISCPKCSYVWRPGWSELEEAELIAQKTAYVEHLQQMRKDEARAVEYLEQAEEYIQRFMQFKRLTQTYPRLGVLWDYILDHQYHLNYPASHIGFFHEFQHEVTLHAEINRLDTDAHHLMELMERDKLRRGESSSHFEERLGRLKEAIGHTTQRLGSLSQEQATARGFHGQMRKWEENYRQLDQAWQVWPQLYQGLVEVQRNQALDKVIGHHQSALAAGEQKLTRFTTLQGIVTDLDKSAEELKNNLDAYKVILKELSPTDGLIADCLNSSINCLVAQLNSVIKAIWEYDLVVLPCGNSAGELDYKFPLDVDNGKILVGDVKEGSTAQQEVVDFAFKLTAMLYLGLKEYPLYLDELGASFDEQHRIAVMNFVKRLVDTGYHRQLFLVSHYAVNHGAFTNAQILVMDDRNIAVPKEYNTHVVMN